MAKKTTVKKQTSKGAAKGSKANPVVAILQKLPLWQKLILGVATAALLFLAYVSVQPDEFLVERQITIESPVAKIFPHINDLHQWGFWYPWAKMDPKAVITFDGPKEGLGSSYHWVSTNPEVGEGTLTITDSQENNQITIDVDQIKPVAKKEKMIFFFMLNGNETGIKWRMTGKNSFMDKMNQQFVNLDTTLGVTFQRGLEYIKVATQPGYKTNS